MRGSGPELVWGLVKGWQRGTTRGIRKGAASGRSWWGLAQSLRGKLAWMLETQCRPLGPAPLLPHIPGNLPRSRSSSLRADLRQPRSSTGCRWWGGLQLAQAELGPMGAAPWTPPLWAGCHSQAHEVVQSALRSQFCKHPRVSRPLTTRPACKAWAPSAPGEGPGGARSPSRGGDRPAEQVVSLRAGQAWGNKQQTTAGGAPLPGSSSVLQVPLPWTQTQAQAGAWSEAAGLHSLGSGHLVGCC